MTTVSFYHPPSRDAIDAAKDRFRIPALWAAYGFNGTPSKSCKCPFHEDRSASFTVFAEGQGWKCFAGCGKGDAITFVEKAKGLSQRDATKVFLEMAGAAPLTPQPRAERKEERPPKRWPEFENPNALDGFWPQLVSTRGFSIAGIKLAVERGVMQFAAFRGQACWFVTDSRREAAQARRMDGKPFYFGENKAKALTLPGSAGGWPVGATEIGQRPFVLLVEGGPDLLAAHCVIAESGREDVAAVAMLGASMRIDARAGEFFKSKTVRIIEQNDPAGKTATPRWASELTACGAKVQVATLSGFAGKDLNDAIKTNPLKNFAALLP